MHAALTKAEFRRRFQVGLIVAWMIPPATGELGMTFLGFWELREAGLSLVRFTGAYVIAFTLVAFFLFRRLVIEPVMALGEQEHSRDPAHTKRLKAFPWIFWGLLSLYCALGPPSVLLSNAVFDGKRYTFGQYAFSAFGVIPFLLVAAFPLFFYLTDLLGRFLAPRGIVVLVAPFWLKGTVLGLFTPIMIDTILLTYYFNRTGFLEAETIVLWFLLLLTAGLGTWVALRSCYRGLSALRQPLGGIDEADLRIYPVAGSLDEFGLLAQGWAELLQARDRAEQQVRERDARTQDIIDNTDAVIYVKDQKGRYMLVNRRYEQLFGVSNDDVVGKTDHDVFPRETADALRQSDLDVIRDEGPLQTQEIVPGKHEPRTYVTQRFPLHDAQGVLYGVCGVSTDITERKQADEERERLVVELEARNAELERFTYTVSHDLKSPLITIRGFVGLLETDAAGKDPERLKRDIEHIDVAAERMQQMLEDLLELSRIGRWTNPPQEVSLGTLAREAVEMVAGQIAKRGVQVEIPPDLPVVFGDRSRLLALLENLVDNAAKFMGDQPKPLIQIGATTRDEETVCYVRDNGVGIDPRYHEKVFGLFDKLDRGEEGTGIGLAVVKRIVELHGGRIWIESNGRGRGCTFCFALPEHGGLTDGHEQGQSARKASNDSAR